MRKIVAFVIAVACAFPVALKAEVVKFDILDACRPSRAAALARSGRMNGSPRGRPLRSIRRMTATP